MTQVLTPFVERQARHSEIPRREILEARQLEYCALTIIRAASGMGKTTTARQLAARHQRRGAEVYEVNSARLDAAGREAIETFLRDRAAKVTLIIDDIDRATNSGGGQEFANWITELLEIQAHTAVIACGSNARALESHYVSTRVPVCVIDDIELAFTPEEVTALSTQRMHEQASDPDLVLELHRTTGGWPLAVTYVLANATQLRKLVSPRHAVERLGREIISTGETWWNERHRVAISLVAVVGKTHAGTLALALDISETDAEIVLDELSTVLQQGIDEEGTRWYRAPAALQRVLAQERLRVLGPDDLLRLGRKLRNSDRLPDDRAVWLEIYGALELHDWELLNALTEDHFSEEFIAPNTRLRELIRAIPASVQTNYPLLHAVVLLEEYAHPQRRRGSILSDLQKFATRTLNAESQLPGLLGIRSIVLRIAAARVIGDEATVTRMSAQLRDKVDRLTRQEITRARTTLVTVANQMALTSWYRDEFHEADAWIRFSRDLVEGRASLGAAHLAALSAAIAAFRGNIRQAMKRLRDCERLRIEEEWGSHYVAVNYWLAKSVVALEQGDIAAAKQAYQVISSRLATNENWPYFVWVRTHIFEQEMGGSKALAWLQSQLQYHHDGTLLMSGARNLLEDLLARLAWKNGLYQHLPSKRRKAHLIPAYVALAKGDFTGANAAAASAMRHANNTGYCRAEARAMLVQVAVLHEIGEVDEEESRLRSLSFLERHGLTLPLLERPPWWDDLAQTADATEEDDIDETISDDLPDEEPDPQPKRSRRATGTLTPAELRTLRAVARHETTTAAAKHLTLSVHTVRDHMKAVYRKLGVNTRADAIQAAAATGLLPASLAS